MEKKVLTSNINKSILPLDADFECKCREAKPNWMPAIEYLCHKFDCSPKELQVVFSGLQNRRELIDHLQHDVVLKTSHIRPPFRNFIVRCGDMTTQSANLLPALGGYLNVTVNLHRLKLKNVSFR